MATFLLTWNPERWQWNKLNECIREIEKFGYYIGSWSCGLTKKIRPDDRVFLIKLGAEPLGIIASGLAISEVYEDKHWDEKARAKGKRTFYIKVEFDTILNPQKRIFTRIWSSKGIYSKMSWNPQASGVTIPDYIAEKLERDWEKFLNHPVPYKEIVFAEEAEVDRTFTEGAKRRITVNAYERRAKARTICINHYGLNCSVCDFNFENVYGKIGIGFIHVHHLIPLSEKGKNYKLNTITDLSPVYPNCHAIIHQHRPAYSIEELKAILRKKQRNV